MARHRPLGYEQPPSNLLVAEALSDQPGNLCFTLAERCRTPAVRGGDGGPDRLTKRERHGLVSARTHPSVELGLECRGSERGQRLTLAPGAERSEDSIQARAGPRSQGLRGPKKPRRPPRLPRAGGMAAQGSKEHKLCHAVVDLVRDPHTFGQGPARLVHVFGDERGKTQVHEHVLEAVEITDLPAQPCALGRKSTRRNCSHL